VYWCVTNNQHEYERWGEDISFAGANMNRDIVILYMWQLGKFPYFGPHRHAMDPTWLDKHLAQIPTDLDTYIPDPNFSGLVIIDYENWSLTWERTRNEPGDPDPFAPDKDYHDDWRDHIRSDRPELLQGLDEAGQERVFKETYQECAKDIYLQTLNACRALRPNAKYAFWGYPVLRYRYPRELPPGTIGYDDLTHTASQLNDELDWLWEAQDFICSAVYAPYTTIPEGRKRGDHEDWPSQFGRFLDGNIAESLRVAGGKPVYPCVSLRYTTRAIDQPWLNDTNLQMTFESLLKESDAAGAIVWGNIKSQKEAGEFQDYVEDRLAPTLLAIEPRLAADNGDQGPTADDQGSKSGGASRSAVQGTVRKQNSVRSTRVQKAPFPFRFQGKADRVSKPKLTRQEVLEARRRAAQQKPKSKPPTQ
jgi:hypothetical protein